MRLSSPTPKSTLRLHHPLGQTPLLACALIALALGSSEAFFRIPQVRSGLPAPSVSSNASFDIKLMYLEDLIAQSGPIDCIFLGTSTVWDGIDPETFRQTLIKIAGQNIRCFNFGIPGLYASTAVDVASLFVSRYHPRLLIFGVDPTSVFHPINNGVEDTPWLRYELEEFSLGGWAADSLYTYRYWLALRKLRNSDYSAQAIRDRYTLRPDGFLASPLADTAATIDLNRTPVNQTESYWFQYFLSEATARHEIESLAQWTRFSEQGTTVVFVDMPLHPSAAYYFPLGLQDYHAIQTQIQQAAQLASIPIWNAETDLVIPEADWHDRIHLNYEGAKLLSAWLAEQAVKNLPQLFTRTSPP